MKKSPNFVNGVKAESMKKNDFLKVVLVAGLMASASCMNSNAVTASKPKAEVVECVAQQAVQDSMVYLKWGLQVPDVAPQPKKGTKACYQFFFKHFQFPQIYQTIDVTGKMVLELMVNKRGEITDVKIARGIDAPLDEEAVRVARLLPGFKPAKLNGKAIPSVFVMPILIRLE